MAQQKTLLMIRSSLSTLERIIAVLYVVCLPISLTAAWVALTAGLIVWAALALLDRKFELADKPQLPPLTWQIGVFALCVTISGALNGGAEHGTLGSRSFEEALRSLVTLRALLSYFWACHLFTNNARLHYLLDGTPLVPARTLGMIAAQVFLVLTSAAGLFGSFQQLANYHPGYQYLQGTGFMASPMPFAGQMQLASMLALALLFKGSYKHFNAPLNNRFVFCLIVIANCLGVFFAGERSAWLGAIGGTIVCACLISKRALLSAAVAILLIGSTAYLTVPLVKTRLNSMLSGQTDVGTQVRLMLWEKSVQLWQSSPLVGIGIHRFPQLSIPQAIVPGHSKYIEHAHSNYFHLLATTGIIGFGAFILLLGSILRTTYRRLQAAQASSDMLAAGLFLGIAGGTVALMISGAFEYNFGTAQVRLSQWFLLGLITFPVVGATTKATAPAETTGARDSFSKKTVSV